MKSRKKDLRTSRKSKVTSIGRSRYPNGTTTKASNESRNRIKGSKSSTAARTDRNFPVNTEPVSPDDVENGNTNQIHRRRRADTSEYIKKRFLYDVAEPPKRSQRRLKLTHQSTAALMAASSANLSRRKISKKKATKSQYNLRAPENDMFTVDESQLSSMPNIPRDKKRKARGPQYFETKHEPQPCTTWDFPELFHSDSPRHLYSESDEAIDVMEFSNHSVHGVTNNRLLTDRTRHASDQRSRKEKAGRLISRSDSIKQPESFIERPFYSGSSLDDPYSDLLDINPDRFNRRPAKSRISDVDFTDHLSTSPHSPIIPEQSNLPPNEDVEEEELLAPELSLLAETAGLASTDGSLIANIPRENCLLSNVVGTSGSRRKSPVRPMHVLRTKTAPLVNTYSFGANVDHNHPLKHGNRLFGTDTNRIDDIVPVTYQPNEGDRVSIDTGLSGSKVHYSSSSALRIHSSNPATKTTLATSRSLRDHPLDDRSSGSQSEDAFKSSTSNPQSSSVKSARSGKAALVKSLLLAHNVPSGRRRPTILRRSSGGTVASTETEEEPKKTPKSIGVFTPSASSRRPAKKNPALDSSGPTKLLQLITAASLSSSTLTASDKLFGRRSGLQKPSLVANVTMPVVQSRHIDTVKTSVSNTPNSCRYAVLRGSSNGKRYIVLGNNAIFDRSNIAPVVSTPVSVSSTRTPALPSVPRTNLNGPADVRISGTGTPGTSRGDRNSVSDSLPLSVSNNDQVSNLVITALAAT